MSVGFGKLIQIMIQNDQQRQEKQSKVRETLQFPNAVVSESPLTKFYLLLPSEINS